MGLPSDRQFLGLVGKVLPGWCPHLPSQSQHNRRVRRLTPLIASVQLHVSELIAASDLRIADGTLIGVANYAGCASRSEFAGSAAYGYCAAKSEFVWACASVWGMRLVLVTDPAGVPVGYTLVAANEKEYEPVRELTTAHPGCTLIADKGMWAVPTPRRWRCRRSRSSPPDRVRGASNPEREKRLASLRLVIESTISNLKCQMRLEQHLAKTSAGLAQRIVQQLLALTVGMLLVALTGRPPRALVAYDGR